MVSIIAMASLAAAFGSVPIAIFEELPSFSNYIPFSQSSPAIPLVIKIPDDPEVDELISKITKKTVFTSRAPL